MVWGGRTQEAKPMAKAKQFSKAKAKAKAKAKTTTKENDRLQKKVRAVRVYPVML